MTNFYTTPYYVVREFRSFPNPQNPYDNVTNSIWSNRAVVLTVYGNQHVFGKIDSIDNLSRCENNFRLRSEWYVTWSLNAQREFLSWNLLGLVMSYNTDVLEYPRVGLRCVTRSLGNGRIDLGDWCLGLTSGGGPRNADSSCARLAVVHRQVHTCLLNGPRRFGFRPKSVRSTHKWRDHCFFFQASARQTTE